MPIYNYQELEHTGGAKCIRVVVSVGGEYRQKYFRPEEADKAEKWEVKQLAERDAINRKNRRLRHSNKDQGYAYTNTGVSGLRINLSRKKGRGGQKYFRCVIVMSVNSEITGKKAHREYVVTRDNLDAQWYAACKLLCHHKSKVSVPKIWREKCPRWEQFDAVIKGYAEKKSLYDIGFKSLPKSKYPISRSGVLKGY